MCLYTYTCSTYDTNVHTHTHHTHKRRGRRETGTTHNTHTTHTQTDHVTALGSDADFGVSINVGDTAFQELLNAHACPEELTDLLYRQRRQQSHVGEEEHGAERGLEFVRQRHEPQ